MTSAPSIAVQEQRDALSLEESFKFCRSVARKRAKNFYYGMKLTPEPKRSAMYAIYSWMRLADDLADEDGSIEQKEDRLERFRHDTHEALDDSAPLPHGPLWPAFRKTTFDYLISEEYLDDMIDGQLQDQHQFRYQEFGDLYDYCYKVASVVGLTCITVWGYDGGEETRSMAVKRGIGFQLTNILRDLVEDAERNRLYLPCEELQHTGFKPDEFVRVLKTRDYDETFEYRFSILIGWQIDQARKYFEASDGLDRKVHKSCRATSWALMKIYRDLLEKLAENPLRILHERVKLSAMRKMLIGLRATRK